jgi:malonate transporter
VAGGVWFEHAITEKTMTDLLYAFQITIPIILTAGLGWVAGRLFRFPENAETALTRYVVYLAAPAALLVAVAESNLEELLNAKLVLATIIAYALAFGGVLLVHRLALRRSLGDSAFAGFAVAKFNLIIIGFPLVFSVAGAKGTPALVINAFISYLALTPLALFLHGMSGDKGAERAGLARAALNGVKETITNPLIIGSLLGLLVLVLGAKVPTILDAPLRMIGKSVVPVGLVAVGLSIREIKPENWGLEIWLMSITKVLVVPAVTVGLALLLDLGPDSAVSLVLLFCAPSAVVAYALAREVDAYAQESGEIVVLTTILAAIGIPLTAYACQLIWGV